MIHYSCDRCKRAINPEHELHYVVRIEVQPAMDPLEENETDDDRDHLLEIEEILQNSDELQDDLLSDDMYQRRRFDLCADCYSKYAKNPLGREPAMHLGFSQN